VRSRKKLDVIQLSGLRLIKLFKFRRESIVMVGGDELPDSTSQAKIPTNPLELVIGQDEAISIVKVAATQRRNLLLVGSPGTGKSMVAQAMASLLPKPSREVSVLDNVEHPEKPVLEVRSRIEVDAERRMPKGIHIKPADVPVFVAERLGLRCRRCGTMSKPSIPACTACGAEKYKAHPTPFDDIVFGGAVREDKVYATRLRDGKEDRVLYECNAFGEVVMYDEKAIKGRETRNIARNVIIPLTRSNFVQATGATETELLGDVRHDPYGGHADVGVKPFRRVIPGAIHEAHEGVLFIDEISNLGKLQKHILTAMQEKRFPITGRNPTSSGASVRVDNVPCDFILVGALNFGDMNAILPPLRSRILGNGYEVLMSNIMPDNPKNVKKIVQFIAQEIVKDGRIPHADSGAMQRILDESRRRAKYFDGKEGLTLRLRDLAGIIKLAGDSATMDSSDLIEARHVDIAIEKAKPVEQQMQKKYGSMWRTSASDYGVKAPAEDSVI